MSTIIMIHFTMRLQHVVGIRNFFFVNVNGVGPVRMTVLKSI